MSYRIRPTEAALEDVDGIRRWIAKKGAPMTAERWAERLFLAIRTLADYPNRCPVAPEDDEIEEFEVLRFLFGKFRVLFTVVGDEVVILHVRHGGRRYATREELAAALRELGVDEEASE